MTRGMIWPCALILIVSLAVSCKTGGAIESRPLSIQVDEAAEAFFLQAARNGASAQSCFTLFLPEGTVNKRYLKSFRGAVETSLRRASSSIGMHYNASADRVFFLSRHKPPGWERTMGDGQSEAILAREFRNGTRAGWTILHAFWSQYNRLLIGDDDWIQSLPDSVRADLSHPLRYVVRVGISLESNPNVTTFVHRITMALVEVGKERTLLSEHYPLVLSYSLP